MGGLQPPLSLSEFIGWNTEPSGWGGVFHNTTPVMGDTDIYAQWHHEVRFNSNFVQFALGEIDIHRSHRVAGGHSMLTSHVHPGTPNDALQNMRGENGQLIFPTQVNWQMLHVAGFTVAGWNTHRDGTGEWFTAATVVTAPIEVYAIWTSSIVFNPGFGPWESIQDEHRFMEIPFGGSFGEDFPPDPVWPAEYPGQRVPTFRHWINRYGARVDENSIIELAQTFTAVWDAIVTFHGNLGTLTTQYPHTANVDVGAPLGGVPASQPYRGEGLDAWQFMGWRRHPVDPGILFTSIAPPLLGSVDLYAQWYGTVTFNLASHRTV
jgi:hypothetical protein